MKRCAAASVLWLSLPGILTAQFGGGSSGGRFTPTVTYSYLDGSEGQGLAERRWLRAVVVWRDALTRLPLPSEQQLRTELRYRALSDSAWRASRTGLGGGRDFPVRWAEYDDNNLHLQGRRYPLPFPPLALVAVVDVGPLGDSTNVVVWTGTVSSTLPDGFWPKQWRRGDTLLIYHGSADKDLMLLTHLRSVPELARLLPLVTDRLSAMAVSPRPLPAAAQAKLDSVRQAVCGPGNTPCGAQIRVVPVNQPPPKTFAQLLLRPGSAPGGACDWATAGLDTARARSLPLGDGSVLRVPAGWGVAVAVQPLEERPLTRLTSPTGLDVRMRRELNGARGRGYLMYQSGVRPTGVTCAIERGDAGAIWTFYDSDPAQLAPKTYGAFGDVMTPAGAWYSLTFWVPTEAERAKLAGLLSAVLLPQPR